MEDIDKRMTELMSGGLHCSQAIMFALNELREIENPDLVRAVGGLGGGMFRRENCGALTGGACALGLFGARSRVGEEAAFDYRAVEKELVDWFEAKFGHIDCRDLVDLEAEDRFETCIGMVKATFHKCLDILKANGIDPTD